MECNWVLKGIGSLSSARILAGSLTQVLRASGIDQSNHTTIESGSVMIMVFD